MATLKNVIAEEFYKGYLELSDTKKNNFSRLVNKLMNDNFIYASKIDDKSDYYEILSLKSLIENYLSMMDFELIHIDTYKIFYIQTSLDRNRAKLKKLDTILLLVLRLLYYKGSLAELTQTRRQSSCGRCSTTAYPTFPR